MISIIIPIHNTAPYLRECLDSLICQSHQDWEGILIDDGSTDGSGNICDDYALKDQRIRVIHQHNQGLVKTRNTGLQESSGEFITFLDSDDSVHPQWLETLYDIITTNDCDISIVGVLSYHDNQFPINFEAGQHEAQRIPTDQLVSKLYNNQVNAFVWNKLYRKAFIGNTLFAVDKAEDRYFNLMLFIKGAKVFKTDTPLYYYRLRKGSITNTYDATWIANNLISRCNIYSLYKEADDELKYKSTLLKDLYERLLMINLKQILYMECPAGLIKHTSEITRKHTYHDFIMCNEIPSKLKLKAQLLYRFPLIYKSFYKLRNFIHPY